MKSIELDKKLTTLVQSERKITFEILQVIQIIDVQKIFLQFGYPSLFEYLVRRIGYSEGAAQRRISSARLMKECPKIENDIQMGKLKLSQLALAQTAIRQQEKVNGRRMTASIKEAAIIQMKNRNSWQTKTFLKETFPAFELKPGPVPTSDNHVEVTMKFSKDDWEMVKKLQAKLSHKVKGLKLEELILYYCKKEQVCAVAEPLVAEQAPNKIRNFSKPVTKSPPPLRRWIPAAVQRDLKISAGGKCQYISKLSGERCSSEKFLEIDHIRPLALGGGDDRKNLRLYCRSHNQMAAKQSRFSKFEAGYKRLL